MTHNPYLKARNEKGKSLFIPFTVLGDPDRSTSRAVVQALIASGADALELGLPFSDPPADGPVIQAADTRALANGIRIDDCFGILREIRKETVIPIGLLVYYNLVLQRGIETFYRDCKDAGVTSVLIADLPPEHAADTVREAKRFGIAPVFMVSERTTEERLAAIAAIAEGYLYVVSYVGTTGTEHAISEERIRAQITRIRNHTDLPLVVGFGINTTDEAHAVVRAGADGVIIASRLIRELPDIRKMASLSSEFARALA